jgi:hypothetical protein
VNTCLSSFTVFIFHGPTKRPTSTLRRIFDLNRSLPLRSVMFTQIESCFAGLAQNLSSPTGQA